MLFSVDVTPAWRYDASRRGTLILSEALHVAAAHTKVIPSTLYQLVDVKIWAHVALKQAPLVDDALADDEWEVFARRPLNCWEQREKENVIEIQFA